MRATKGKAPDREARKKCEESKAPLAVEPDKDRETGDFTKEVFQLEHDEFSDGTKDKMQEVIANFDGTCREMLRETLFSMLKNGVENESKTNGCEFKQEDVEDIVEFVAEQLKHEVMTLSGKGKQVEFSVATWEIAHSLCSNSKANFRELKKTVICTVLPQAQ